MKNDPIVAGKQPESRARELALDLLFDLVAGLIYGISVQVFTAPNHIAPGGVTGLATLINYVFGLPIGFVATCINVPLLLVAYKVLGRHFVFKTLKTVVIMNLMVDIGIPFLVQGFYYQGDAILAGLMGGVLMGIAIGLVLMRGSTTGGLDVVGRLVKLKLPHIPISKLIFMGDLTVLTISMLVYRNLESGIVGLIYIFVSARMVDTVLYGMEKGKLVYVVTTDAQAVAKAIFASVGRGSTILEGRGSYRNEEKQVLLCALRDQQYPNVKKVVHAVDPGAFVMVAEATDILGFGFRSMEEQDI